MRYESVRLTLTPTEVRDRVRSRVDGVRTRRVDDGYEFRTNSGILVGEVSPSTLPDGTDGARLHYRTSILSATAAHARRTGTAVRDAVADARYRE